MDKFNFKILEWDSNFFKKRVAKVFINDEAFNRKKLQILLKDNNIDVCYINSKYNLQNLVFDEYLCSLSNSHFVYRKKNESAENDIDKSIIDCNKKHFETYKNQILDLAYLSGHKSRFKLDGNFSKDEFEKMYIEWIRNALNKKNGGGINLYVESTEIAGLVTYDFNNSIAKIGLIAVNNAFQGKGIGQKLINSFESKFAHNKDISYFEITTQADNIAASNLYMKNKYKLNEKINISHYWKK
jgi:dTDP-4-amino-4,6-dideoxy-D-galactose acyltransferase